MKTLHEVIVIGLPFIVKFVPVPNGRTLHVGVERTGLIRRVSKIGFLR